MNPVRPLPRTLAGLMGLAGVAIASVPAQTQSAGNLSRAAEGLHQLFLHDKCTGDYAPQPDTCLHNQLTEKTCLSAVKRALCTM